MTPRARALNLAWIDEKDKKGTTMLRSAARNLRRPQIVVDLVLRASKSPTGAFRGTVVLSTVCAYLICAALSVHAQTIQANPKGVFSAGGSVLVSVIQADGKIVIGGNFVAIGGVPRQNIARLNSDGTVDLTFDPSADGQISAIAVSGDVIYIGGDFDTVGGEPRNSIAAVDRITGQVTPWNPRIASSQTLPYVAAIAVSDDGGTVFVGGLFTEIGGAQRRNLAALAANDASALPDWRADASDGVITIALAGNVLYVGGGFVAVGTQTRFSLAAVSADSGVVTDWNPSASGKVFAVYSLAAAGSVVYVGGLFGSIGGEDRNGIAAIDAASGNATSWDPGLAMNTYSIAVEGNIVYVGGNGQDSVPATQNLVAVDATTAAIESWAPNPDSGVMSVSASANRVYAGGGFRNAGNNLTGGFAELDPVTGLSDPTQLSGFDGTISALQSLPDGSVIVGGVFTAIGNVARNNISRLNPDGTVDDSWNPGADVDGQVTALLMSGGLIYVAGDFQNIGGHFRPGLAAVDLKSGEATNWQPQPDQSVLALAVDQGVVYAGGEFTHIGNSPRQFLAALDPSTGLALPWNPDPDGVISALLPIGNAVIAGGRFLSAGGQPRSYLAALDSGTGSATEWNPSPNGPVSALATAENLVYIGGDYGQIGTTSRNGAAAISLASAQVAPWDPAANSPAASVLAMAISGDEILIGGAFTEMGGAPRSNIAAVDTRTGAALGWDASATYPSWPYYDPQASVAAIAFAGAKVYIGGSFERIGSTPQVGLAAVTSPDMIFSNGFE